MSLSPIVWIIIAVVILLALVLLAVKMGSNKKADRDRGKAGDIRQSAASDERSIQEHKAEAAEQEAGAREAQAEADRKAATADKLKLQAQEFSERAAGKETEQRDRLRAADEIDPDVPDPGHHDDGVGTTHRP